MINRALNFGLATLFFGLIGSVAQAQTPAPAAAGPLKGNAEAAHDKIAMCVGCHGIDGRGVQGPNLCDDYWLHGSDVKDLCQSISEGVPLKGMPSWRITGAMGPDDILALAAYVVSLRGSDHGQGKAPEGVLAPITY